MSRRNSAVSAATGIMLLLSLLLCGVLLHPTQHRPTLRLQPACYSYGTLQRQLERTPEEYVRLSGFPITLGMTGPIAYIGGKNRVANQIIATFPAHVTYVEPFAGGAQVLFHKTPSKVEVLNDLDHDIVNFFRICQHHHQELVRYLKFILVSRRWYSLFEQENPDSLTDIQRAGRFYFLQKKSFAGLVRNRRYSYAVKHPPSFNPLTIPKTLEKAHERLARVQIESLPYEEILDRYDRVETLFYLDPPYFQRRLYRFNLSDEDFETLANRLRNLKGKFVLSLNDTPEVRTIFSEFPMREIAFHYTAQREAGKRFKELLIKNY